MLARGTWFKTLTTFTLLTYFFYILHSVTTTVYVQTSLVTLLQSVEVIEIFNKIYFHLLKLQEIVLSLNIL